MPLRILVVDDHDVVRQGVRLILRSRAEWEICGEAENGVEALEKANTLKPDLIVLDISMPGKDGLDVAAELRSRESAAKVVVLTMHESKELARAIQAVGAQGYVIKSHAARDLVKAIQAVAGGSDFFSIDPSPSNPNPSSSDPGKKSPMFRVRLVPSFA